MAQSEARRGGNDSNLVSARIEETTAELFGHCLTAFHAYNDLDQLAEDLRILSLNAELAAGRAGDKGRAVRALTQYTRALVSRLAMVQGDVVGIRATTYATSAAALRHLAEMRTFELAALKVGRPRYRRNEEGDEGHVRAHESLLAAQTRILKDLTDNLNRMVVGVGELSASTGQVHEVVSQSGSIATNIAIEAAAAGQYEAEFRTVAETMRRYVGMLRAIIDKANAAVRVAGERGESLQALAAEALRAAR
ncbi:MAG: chemotaxis protein [Alphaproteobacteria bacterium]